MRVVVKIGTSSLTALNGEVDEDAIKKLCAEVSELKKANHEVIIVTSGAVTAGLPPLGYKRSRPRDATTLQAAAAVGQSRLLRAYDTALAPFGLVGGQILLSSRDFLDRHQYLQARETMARLLHLGVVPIVNKNDAVSDDSIRKGNNDRLAALVAHAIGAELLVLLTDTEGLYTADPRIDENASLVQEVIEVDHHLHQAGGAGTEGGSGGMETKLIAAQMASRSGVRAIIASAQRTGVLQEAVNGDPSVGTIVQPRDEKISARKLWIAYALASSGAVTIDDGARRALVERNRSLLPAGVVAVSGTFEREDGIEVLDASGRVIAKGLTQFDSKDLAVAAGRKTSELSEHLAGEVVHKDDLVVLV